MCSKSSDPKPFKPPKLAEKAAKLIAAEDLDKDSVDCPEVVGVLLISFQAIPICNHFISQIDLDEDSDDWPEFVSIALLI